MWKDLFAFTKAERRGIIVLSVLLLLIILFRTFKDDIFPPKPLNISVEYIHYSPQQQSNCQSLNLSKFDPNLVDSLTLAEMNLPAKIIKNILNYRTAGGKFRKPDDLQKLYAIDSVWMDSLRGYITIKPTKKLKEKKFAKKEKEYIQPQKTFQTQSIKSKPAKTKLKPKIELNSADTTQLKTIYGIGSVYAKRIVKFRELLGGYYTVEQLKEVYGMREETYQKIHSYITIDKTRINKLPINKLWQYSLQRHPYCSKKQAKAIIHYRKENGKITDYGVLKSIEVKDQTWEKLIPYINYE